MSTVRRAVLPLRVFLVVLFAILLVFQTLSIPGSFAYMAETSPDQAQLQWPLTAIGVFWVLCVQVVVVCTWRLLGLVVHDRIFTAGSLVWVDAILVAIGAGWLVLAGVLAWIGTHADDPGAPMLFFLLTVVVAVVWLVVLVMRALLQQATALRTDLDAVI